MRSILSFWFWIELLSRMFYCLELCLTKAILAKSLIVVKLEMKNINKIHWFFDKNGNTKKDQPSKQSGLIVC